LDPELSAGGKAVVSAFTIQQEREKGIVQSRESRIEVNERYGKTFNVIRFILIKDHLKSNYEISIYILLFG